MRRFVNISVGGLAVICRSDKKNSPFDIVSFMLKPLLQLVSTPLGQKLLIFEASHSQEKLAVGT